MWHRVEGAADEIYRITLQVSALNSVLLTRQDPVSRQLFASALSDSAEVKATRSGSGQISTDSAGARNVLHQFWSQLAESIRAELSARAKASSFVSSVLVNE